MQGDLPAGTYIVSVSIDNKNEVDDLLKNGLIRLSAIDGTGVWGIGQPVLRQGYQTKEFTFTLTQPFNTIGFQVARIGRGDDLEMSVLEFKIVSYKK